MIKNLFLLFWAVAFLTTMSKAQVSSVTGQYLQDNNLLLNPGFESGIGKWTNSAGTFTADYSVFVQGKASGKVVLSSQALNFFQDSTIFASQLADGMQAILTVKIKSSVAGVRVCPRQAGSVITSLCINVQGNNKWGLYQIPFVTGATSQGVSINSNGNSITGTVYVDESYVGVSNILNSSSEAKLAGEAYFAGTTGCNWTRTSTTVGAFGTVAACPGPTIANQFVGSWQTTDSDLPRVTVNNLPAGTYKAQFIFGSYQTSASVSAFAINDGTTTCEAVKGNTGSVSLVPLTIECSFNYTSAGNRVFELYAASASSTINVANDQPSSPRASIKFILEYYGSNSTYTTLNADTGWASCGHTTSSFTGFGTVSAIETQCKREGSDLLMRGKFTSGVSTATEARLSLPVWNGAQITSAGTSQIPSIQLSGFAGLSANIATIAVATLIEPSVTYITFGYSSGTTAQLTKQQGSNLISNGQLLSFSSRIPIEGWQNSNIIIGQFNEVMTTPGITKPKTCYYAFGGASATLTSPTECTTGTCVEVVDTCGTVSPPTRAAQGVYDVVTFSSGSFANSSYLKCDCVAFDTTSAVPRDCNFQFKTGNQTWVTNSLGGASLNVISIDATGTSGQDAYISLKCEGTAP